MDGLMIRFPIEGPAGPLNNAIASVVFAGSSFDVPGCVMTAAAYFTKAMQLQGVDALLNAPTSHTIISGVVGPGVTEGFDAGYWADWITKDSDLPAASAWGFATGGLGTSLASAGISVTVMEGVAAGGRHNGRQYLPWTCKDAITSTGLVGSSVRTDLVENYRWKLLGDLYTRPTWAAGITPGVKNNAGVVNAVQVASVSANPARLRSRVR